VSREAARTVREILRDAASCIGGESARLDAELLLSDALERPRAWLFAHDDAVPDARLLAVFDAALQRRLAGEPIAYIRGRACFWTLELEVSATTLVPRPETELLVEIVLAALPPERQQVLDLGTGSGAIALALAHERPDWSVVGVDIDPDSVALAARNAACLGLHAEFLQGSWYSPIAGRRFDAIVSNPPYIVDGEPCLAAPGVCREPLRALVAGPDGLAALREVVAGAPAHLQLGGLLACEHGATQGGAVRALLQSAGFVQVETRDDLAGLPRVSVGRMPERGEVS
jgi:release factor glutamine methyltransferase